MRLGASKASVDEMLLLLCFVWITSLHAQMPAEFTNGDITACEIYKEESTTPAGPTTTTIATTTEATPFTSGDTTACEIYKDDSTTSTTTSTTATSTTTSTTAVPTTTTVSTTTTTAAVTSTSTTPETTTTTPETTTTTEVPTTTTAETTTTADTTTTATETSTSTETTTTTEASTTTTSAGGPCTSYTTDDGRVLPNRCSANDTNAICATDVNGKVWCTCSTGWTGTYCTVDVQAFNNIGGNNSGGLVDVINTGKTNPAALIATLPALLSFLTDEQRKAMSYSVDEVILEATFEEKPLDIYESFTLFNDPSLGNCFTFNHYNASFQYKARGVGPRHGLRVALQFQVEQYAPWVEAAGVSSYVHRIGQDIYLESAKYTVQPGYADQVAMNKRSFARMRSIFTTKCAASKKDAQSFYFDGEYSVDGCLRSCYQDSVYRYCGCMDPSYARDPAKTACRFDKLECVYAMAAKRGDPYYWAECKCPNPCNEDEYRYETSKAMLLQSIASNATNSTTASTSEIILFLTTLDVYAQKEVWKFPFSIFLGQIGGFAGVLLGASVVALVDIAVLIVRVVLIAGGSLNALAMKKNPFKKEAGL